MRQPVRGRVVRVAFVAVLGVVLGGAGYLTIRVLSAPGPRVAPGWSLLAEMPSVRGETAVAVAGGRLYVVGGLTELTARASDDVSSFDAAANAWTAGPPLPDPRHHAAAAAGSDGTIYVSGGAPSVSDWTPATSLWALPAGATSWSELAPMPEARMGHRMVEVAGRLYVVGGVAGPGSGVIPGSVLAFDPANGAWTSGAPMPLSRDHLAVVAVDGEIWAIGGRAGGANHARVDIYDPAADAWRSGPSLPEATSGAAEAMVDGVIYLSGGEDPGRGLIVDRHWQLDTNAGSPGAWQALPPPPYTVHGGSGAAIDGTFIVVSGSLRPGGESSTAWTGATQAFAGASR